MQVLYYYAFLVLLLIPGAISVEASPIRLEQRTYVQRCVKPDETYIISKQIDLHGGVLRVPSNSTLKFRHRGSISNGFIVGNNTIITGHPSFSRIRLSGTFKTQVFHASWFRDDIASDMITDIMNLSHDSKIIVDKDIKMMDRKQFVDHLYLEGKAKRIINSDRFYVTYGGCHISDLKFRWKKTPVADPIDNYSAVVIYRELLHKDTTITTTLINVDADGGRYCSYFMKQHKNNIHSCLRAVNHVKDCKFTNFTRGGIWACGGTGYVTGCAFNNIGYDSSPNLRKVVCLQLGCNNTIEEEKAKGYFVDNCHFRNTVAAYNDKNDGRGLHGLLVYGDSTLVRNNRFITLSTSFSQVLDPGMDSEILYIKGSYNRIENNYFQDGAGTKSDAVVTLKIGGTKNNTVKDNKLFNNNINACFINIGGINHLIEGNEFVSKYEGRESGRTNAIFLLHHPVDLGQETVAIINNRFSFPRSSNYLVVYANRWGDINIEKNHFVNPRWLLKYNDRTGCCNISQNGVFVDGVTGDVCDNFIWASGDNGTPVTVSENEFEFSEVNISRLLAGDNYIFSGNAMKLKKSVKSIPAIN